MSSTTISKRYSESDLAEFKAVIEKKIAKTTTQLEYLDAQLAETAETKDSQGDWMDDSSNNSDIEMLQTMANRQRKHLLDLQNASQRVHNKSYGICVLSRELIDKRRLLAVPTTTKSLMAKVAAQPEPRKVFKPTSSKPKIISKVIRKPKPTTDVPKKNWIDDEEEEFNDLELMTQEEIDLDNYSEEDLD